MAESGVWAKPGKERAMINGQQTVKAISFPQEVSCIRIGDFKALRLKGLWSFSQRKATWWNIDIGRKGRESPYQQHSSAGRACSQRDQALPHCQRQVAFVARVFS